MRPPSGRTADSIKETKLNQRDATTIVTALFIPKLGGKLRQL
jgi:hypothetical protein